VPLVDIHELAAGKLAALLSRHASRDLFDAHQLLTTSNLDRTKLRLAFVIYGAINRKDWRTVSVADVDIDASDLEAAENGIRKPRFRELMARSAAFRVPRVAVCSSAAGRSAT
jgi:predicted nucleotidyltransferase component of viral defense system